MPRRERLATVAVILSAALLIALLTVAGCSGRSPHPSPPVPSPAATTYTPPESARTPEGPLNPSPPKPQAPPVSVPRLVAPVKHIDPVGLRLIEGFENVYKAIYCPEYDQYGGVWDIGFGQTEGIGPHSACITHAQAEANLRYLVVSRYEWAIRALDVPFNEHEWDALCSFVWNLGAGIFENTTVGADLRGRQYYAATRVMLEYDHAGGVVLPGLKTRREIEVRLFLTPEPKPKPAPLSPAEKRRLIRYWTAERASTLHRYHLDGCRGSSTGPKCTALRKREHDLYRDIQRLR
jgi:lysozyme